MSLQATTQTQRARVIVLGNEKGGSGKSTVAMHIAVALLKSGRTVATIDVDAQQRSFTNYVENRRAWAERRGRALELPDHFCIDGPANDEAAANNVLADAIGALADAHEFIVIDTPGHGGLLSRLVHSLADIMVTPLNDSFVDFDVLGAVDPETFGVVGASHYADIVSEARQQRVLRGEAPMEWFVLRNRLSMLKSRNKRTVGDSLQQLSERLNFRLVDGLAERVIFREFFPRGLTALDDLNEGTLGARPTMSHVTARQEVENLIKAIGLGQAATIGPAQAGSRNAA